MGEKCLPVHTPEDAGKATRLYSQDCLNAIASAMPDLIGGSADLAPSNMTLMKCTGDFLKDSYEGRNMRFGIREFGMAIALFPPLSPYPHPIIILSLSLLILPLLLLSRPLSSFSF